MPLRRGEHGQVGHRPVGPPGEPAQQHQQLPGQPFDGGGVEECRVVAQLDVQLRSGYDHHAERVVGRLNRAHVTQPQAVFGRSVVVDRVVLEHHDAVEQVHPARYPAARLELWQGQEVEVACLGLRGLDAAQPIRHRLPAAYPYPRRKGVDEHADHRLHAGQVRRAAGDGGTEHHVALAAVARQQQRPGTLDHRVHRQPLGPGDLAQVPERRGGQRGADLLHRARPVRLHGYPVIRQRGRRLEPGEDPAPVLLGLRLVALGQPAQEVLDRTPRRRRQGTAAGQRRVLLADLAEHLRRAPPVEQHVVEGPHHLNLGVGEPGHRQPQQRCGGQVETLRTVLGEQSVERVATVHIGQWPPVEKCHREGGVVRDHLQWLRYALPRDPAAQHRVAVDHPLPGRGQQRGIAYPVEHERDLFEVETLVALRQAVEDHAALHRGERVDVLDGTAVADQPVHGRLVEAGQREVRRRTATGARFGAVRDDVPQRLDHPVRQPPDRRLVVQRGGVLPGELQALVLDSAHHVEDSAPSSAKPWSNWPR